ncbi:MAG TPA: MarR family transcriptional regulator [Candidatus Pelethocola excrementipullorum]|nr:MarR family transcriptional regulator [Candidatus Pelethocola excrementipullorum]
MKTKKQYGESNDLNLKTVIALSRSNNKMQKRSNAIFRDAGLTTMQFSVLEVLYHKGDLKIGEIISKILATGGNMTVVINNLEKEKLIEKCPDPKDSRASVISITEKGKKKMEDVFPKHLQDLEIFFSKITEEEKKNLIQILKKLDE